MKRLILLLIVMLLAKFVVAQISIKLPTTSLKDLLLVGHVKEIIDLNYEGSVNDNSIIDTLHKPFKTIMRFDERGNELEEIAYDTTGNVLVKSSFDYAHNKTVIVNQSYDNGRFFHRSIFKYDDKGNKIECDFSQNIVVDNVPDTTHLKYIYKYDLNGSKIEVNVLSKDTIDNKKFIFLFNEKHQKIEMQEYYGADINYDKTLYTYDKYGNQVKSEEYTIFNKLIGGTTCNYSKMDEHRNWLLKVYQEYFHPDQNFSMTQKGLIKRIITYY